MFDVQKPATLGQLTQLYMGNPHLTPTQVGNSLSMQPAGYIDKQGEALGLGNPTQYFQKQYDARKSAMQAGEAQAYAAQSGQAPARQAAPAPVASLQPYSMDLSGSSLGDLALEEAKNLGQPLRQYVAEHGGLSGMPEYKRQRSRDNPQIDRQRGWDIQAALDRGDAIPARKQEKGATHIVDYTTPEQFFNDRVFVRLMETNPDAAGKLFTHLMKRDMNEVIKERREMGVRQAITTEARNWEAAKAKEEAAKALDVKLAGEERASDAAIMKDLQENKIRFNPETGFAEVPLLEPNKQIYEVDENGDIEMVNGQPKLKEQSALGGGSSSSPAWTHQNKFRSAVAGEINISRVLAALQRNNPKAYEEVMAKQALFNNPEKRKAMDERKRRMEEKLPDSTFNDMGGISAMPTRNQIAYTEAAQQPGATGLRSFSSKSPIRLPWQSDPESQEGSPFVRGLKGASQQFMDTVGNTTGSANMDNLKNFGKGFANFFGGQWAKTPVDYSHTWADYARQQWPANAGVRHVSQQLKDNPEIQQLLITDRPRALGIIAALQTQSPEQMSPEVAYFFNLL